MIIIAIDPDVKNSGIASIDKKTKIVNIRNISFPELVAEQIPMLSECSPDSYKLYVESIAHTKHNFHIKQKITINNAHARGVDVGRVSEVQTKIVEMCEHFNVPCQIVMPLRKCWSGPDGKITHAEIKDIVENASYEFPYKKSNQEQRDALLIAWNYAELPIMLSSKGKMKSK